MDPGFRAITQSVLVTGAAGFVGSRLLCRLAAHGIDATGIDLASRVSVLPRVSGHRIIPADITSEPDVYRVLSTHKYSALVHCAALTSIQDSIKDPARDRSVNVHGTKLLLKYCMQTHVQRVVFLSSGGALYGDVHDPASEDTIESPVGAYGIHKKLGEELVQSFSNTFAILRPSNIYGPGQERAQNPGVVSIFLQQLLRGQPLPINGDGSHQRDFVYVEDVVDAITLALRFEGNVLWNVCSGRSISVLDLATIIANKLGREPKLVFRAAVTEASRSLMSPQTLLATGEWGPPVNIREGLDRLIASMYRATQFDSPLPRD